MPLSDTFTKLENIAKLPGKNDKRALLKSYLNNDVFRQALILMFSEDKTFHIKVLPEVEKPNLANSPEIIFEELEKLAARRGASAADKASLAQIVGSGATREVVIRILEGKSKAGFTARSINKVLPGTVFQTPYQRCSPAKNLHRVSHPAIVQKKADGMFNYALPEGFMADIFLSRRGKFYNLLGHLEKEIEIYRKRLENEYPDAIIVGEFTLKESDGKTMPRKKGNGILNKAIKGTIKEDQARQVVFNIWDVLSGKDFRRGECSIAYIDRWDDLSAAFNQEPTAEEAAVMMEGIMVSGISQRVQLIETEQVETPKEAQEFYEKMRNAKEEGAILKDHNTIWKSNTSPTLVKMKHFAQAEFRITAVNEGKERDKYAGMMGSLTVATDDGLVVSNVGSGFSDPERKDIQFWKDSIGKIITVQFESVISDKNRPGVMSLNLPTFIETRFNEKTETDTLKYLEEL